MTETREWIENKLAAVEFVDWDRFVAEKQRDGYQFKIYGWIDRERDDYKDFVVARFWTNGHYIETLTSSDRYSEEIQEAMLGGGDGGEHLECRRVENWFKVPNAIQLEEAAADGGGGR